MKQTIQKKIGDLSIEKNQKFYLELLERKRQREYKIYNEFKHLIKVLLHWIYLVIIVVAIGVISALVGIASKGLIYALNKPLGEGYSLYASYIESALVGVLLWYSFFPKNNPIK